MNRQTKSDFQSLKVNRHTPALAILCLYVSYDGLLDPLGQSQILPYIQGLAAQGYRFVLISFEKTDRPPSQIEALKVQLAGQGIRWQVLPFRRGRFQYIWRILRGTWALRVLASRHHPDLVHARTILAAALVRLAYIRAPLIYDNRSFAGEWIDANRLRPGSPQAQLFQALETHLIRTAAGLVVLDQSGAAYLREAYPSLSTLIQVVPTCTDPTRFPLFNQPSAASPLRFVFLGGARFPYRPDLALQLIHQLVRVGVDCRVDFINESDHSEIRAALAATGFPYERCRIVAMPQARVPEALVQYHCGLVFNTSGRWRRMSSPTKLGEYLAAGLHVLGLSGINALDRLAASHPSLISVLSEDQLSCGLPPEALKQLVALIRGPDRPNQARELASAHYGIQLAHQRYATLYQQVLHPTR